MNINTKQLEQAPAVSEPAKRRSPLRAIRAFCVDCSGGSLAEAKRCHMVDCPLWSYRTGKSGRKGRTLTDEQRAAVAERSVKPDNESRSENDHDSRTTRASSPRGPSGRRHVGRLLAHRGRRRGSGRAVARQRYRQLVARLTAVTDREPDGAIPPQDGYGRPMDWELDDLPTAAAAAGESAPELQPPITGRTDSRLGWPGKKVLLGLIRLGLVTRPEEILSS